ncbi:MAG: hypothetical protein HY510_05830 [Acidobacteria bacterium]|nr:hypothetical protein [Acidobacteriota bacterium]
MRLRITKEHITVGLRKNGEIIRPLINPGAEIHLFGQEVNPETWAVSKSDLKRWRGEEKAAALAAWMVLAS